MSYQTTGTGATPGSGATPGQPTGTSDGAKPSTTSTANPPATGEEALGDPGKAILREARAAAKAAEERAKAAEDERDALRAATQTDTERAIAKAKREGASEVTARLHEALRRSGVKTALVAAGVNAELLDLATKDDVFADLKVSDEGDVEGLDAAVAALRKGRPSLFVKSGDFGGGNRGATPPTNPSMNDLMKAAIRG